MKRIIFCCILALAIISCRDNGSTTSNAPVLEDSSILAAKGGKLQGTFHIYAPENAVYSNDQTTPVRGYWIYYSQTPNDPDAQRINVGLTKDVPLQSIIPTTGIWYLSASEYDDIGESARSIPEIVVRMNNGGFFQVK